MDDRVSEAAALRGLRALAGLTQDKLAARIGLSHPTFGAVEAGRHPKFHEHRAKVLAALGVTEEDFAHLTRIAAELAERKEATNARKQRKVRKAGSPKRPGR